MVIKMRYLGVITILAMFLLLAPMVSAEQELKTISDTLYFRPNLPPDTLDYMEVNINPPDKIDGILDFTFHVVADVKQGDDFELLVKKIEGGAWEGCIPTSYTNFGADIYRYDMYFECSIRMSSLVERQKPLNFNVSIEAIGGNARNIHVSYEMTYYNNPDGNMLVHGTEYVVGVDDIAKPWLQLLDSNGSYVTEGICYIDIYTPNAEELVEKTVMTNMNHDGIYYYDLAVPRAQGVYPVIAKCYYEATQEFMTMNNTWITVGSVVAGTVADTWYDDGNSYNVRETTGAPPRRIEYGFNLTQSCNASEALMTGISFDWTGTWGNILVNDYLTISIWNYTSSAWLDFPNTIPGGVAVEQKITNVIIINNTTTAGLTTVDQGPMKFKIVDTAIADSGLDTIYNNYVTLSCDQLKDPSWQEVKGSSEIHVSAEEDYGLIIEGGELFNQSFLQRFLFKYTVESFVSAFTPNATIHLPLPQGAFPCGHLNNVSVRNLTTGLYQNITVGTHEDLIDGRCVAHLEYDLYPGENYDVKVDVENYWKKRLFAAGADIDLLNVTASIGCYSYQNATGLTPYQVPATDPLPHPDDAFHSACAGFLDSVYRWNEVFFTFLMFGNINYNFTEIEIHSLEGLYDSAIEIELEVTENGNTILNALSLGNAYSQAILLDPTPPTNPNFSKYFANISSSYINYLAISQGVPGNVWAYGNRSLTNYTIDADAVGAAVWDYDNRTITNATNIANAVWSFSGTIGANIITQVVAGVWDYAGVPVTTLLNNITANVWDYANRSLTNYTTDADAIWDYDNRSLTNYTDDLSGIADAVWDESNRSLTNYTTNADVVWDYANRSLTNYTSDTAGIAVAVWASSNRSLTNYSQAGLASLIATEVWEFTGDISSTIIGNFSDGIWTFGTRNLTYYNMTDTSTDKTNYTKINEEVPQYVWTYTFRNLTDYGTLATDLWNFTGNVSSEILDSFSADIWRFTPRNVTDTTTDKTNYTKINEEVTAAVWSDSNRSLTNYSFAGLAIEIWNHTGNISSSIIDDLGEGIWTFSIRNLTWYNMTDTSTDKTNYTKINEEVPVAVWTYTARNLTDVESIWAYENRSLTNYSSEGFAGEVWDYANRSLTNYTDDTTGIADAVWDSSNRSLTNYTTNADTVWDYANRSLTNYTDDLTGIADAVWDSSNRSLTNYTDDLTGIADAVWDDSNRSLTNYSQAGLANDVADAVWDDSNRSLTNYSQGGIAGLIWGYNNRSLTNYSENLIATKVWSYSGTIGATIINQIVAGIWDYAGVPATTLLNNFSSNIWNTGDRNLTYYNMSDTTNYTRIDDKVDGVPTDVWAYENRTVTGGNISAGNVTISGNVSIDTADIWSYSGEINSNITGQISNDTWNASAKYTHGVIV